MNPGARSVNVTSRVGSAARRPEGGDHLNLVGPAPPPFPTTPAGLPCMREQPPTTSDNAMRAETGVPVGIFKTVARRLFEGIEAAGLRMDDEVTPLS
jgi:hypothetical protein